VFEKDDPGISDTEPSYALVLLSSHQDWCLLDQHHPLSLHLTSHHQAQLATRHIAVHCCNCCRPFLIHPYCCLSFTHQSGHLDITVPHALRVLALLEFVCSQHQHPLALHPSEERIQVLTV
jgi:hypothetical protein